jgi:phosphoribosyl-ATP pyrophosphohydrolase
MTNYRIDTLAALNDRILGRRGDSPETSYTARLIAEGTEKCAKKLGEEAVELALAAMTRDGRHIGEEAADLLYHLLVLLAEREVPLDDVMAELERRTARSGFDEKAARRS